MWAEEVIIRLSLVVMVMREKKVVVCRLQKRRGIAAQATRTPADDSSSKEKSPGNLASERTDRDATGQSGHPPAPTRAKAAPPRPAQSDYRRSSFWPLTLTTRGFHS